MTFRTENKSGRNSNSISQEIKKETHGVCFSSKEGLEGCQLQDIHSRSSLVGEFKNQIPVKCEVREFSDSSHFDGKLSGVKIVLKRLHVNCDTKAWSSERNDQDEDEKQIIKQNEKEVEDKFRDEDGDDWQHDNCADNNIKEETENSTKSFKCSLCNYLSRNSAHLKRHLAQKHEDVKKLRCPLCSFITVVPSRFRLHLISNHSGKSFKCTLCEFASRSTGSLNCHLANEHKIIVKETRHCEYNSRCETSILNVQVKERPKVFVCQLCNRNFKTLKHLIDHLNSHEEIKPYICEFCKKRFESNSKRNLHTITHTREANYLCNQCPKSFLRKPSLKEHIQRAPCVQRHKCTLCDLQSTPSGLRQHMKLIHDKEIITLACVICGKEKKRLFDEATHEVCSSSSRESFQMFTMFKGFFHEVSSDRTHAYTW